MNETQLTDELSSAMQDAAAGLRLPPGAAQRARARARTRRRLTRGLLAAVPAAGLAAAATVVLTRPGAVPHGRAPVAGPASPAGPAGPATVTDAYVIKHVEAALGGIGHSRAGAADQHAARPGRLPQDHRARLVQLTGVRPGRAARRPGRQPSEIAARLSLTVSVSWWLEPSTRSQSVSVRLKTPIASACRRADR
jgi:hypothetical protein